MDDFKPRIAAPEADLEKVSNAQHRYKALEIGLVGRLFGTASEKPGNIAGFVIVVAFVGILLIVTQSEAAEVPRRDLIASLISIITGALGFVFGRVSKD